MNNENSCLSKCPDGKYPDATGVCKVCPSECVLCLAASQCTKCTNNMPDDPENSFYYVNYQCKRDCPARYFPDSSTPKNLFCRSCPSLCNYCNDENTCTICDIGFYLDYFFGETRRLCVDRCQPGRYPDNSTMECKSCLSNCQTCDNGTTCFQCTQGYVLSIQGTTYSCISTCPTG